jgi:hypothetical protein
VSGCGKRCGKVRRDRSLLETDGKIEAVRSAVRRGAMSPRTQVEGLVSQLLVKFEFGELFRGEYVRPVRSGAAPPDSWRRSPWCCGAPARRACDPVLGRGCSNYPAFFSRSILRTAPIAFSACAVGMVPPPAILIRRSSLRTT